MKNYLPVTANLFEIIFRIENPLDLWFVGKCYFISDRIKDILIHTKCHLIADIKEDI